MIFAFTLDWKPDLQTIALAASSESTPDTILYPYLGGGGGCSFIYCTGLEIEIVILLGSVLTNGLQSLSHRRDVLSLSTTI